MSKKIAVFFGAGIVCLLNNFCGAKNLENLNLSEEQNGAAPNNSADRKDSGSDGKAKENPLSTPGDIPSSVSHKNPADPSKGDASLPNDFMDPCKEEIALPQCAALAPATVGCFVDLQRNGSENKHIEEKFELKSGQYCSAQGSGKVLFLKKLCTLNVKLTREELKKITCERLITISPIEKQ
jgi:hypothetical protein